MIPLILQSVRCQMCGLPVWVDVGMNWIASLLVNQLEQDQIMGRANKAQWFAVTLIANGYAQ